MSCNVDYSLRQTFRDRMAVQIYRQKNAASWFRRGGKHDEAGACEIVAATLNARIGE
ncbi:hypothetical protein [Rhizobium phage RHph_X2_26]|nr:hypothetical protein [Rhizobium phage RHph_X2_26]